METEIFPNYYENFKCIADKCKNSCCKGWEIVIDDDTLELYESLEGDFAERIRENIDYETDCFILKEGKCCPFLNEKGLCDIITEFGDGALCDICYLHPRFSNFHPDFTETGLGLCCEEASRVVLLSSEKFKLQLPKGISDVPFFKKRNEIFDIFQMREISFSKRLEILKEKFDINFNFEKDEIYKLYSSLERLDEKWGNELKKLKNFSLQNHVFEREETQIFFEQLGCYFVFRHYMQGIGFPILSLYVVGTMCRECDNINEMLDIVRMYSSEIEYCEENVNNIIKFINNKNVKR